MFVYYFDSMSTRIREFRTIKSAEFYPASRFILDPAQIPTRELSGVDNEMESSFYTMVMGKVSVHPAGLGPREAGKAWYSIYFITHVQL